MKFQSLEMLNFMRYKGKNRIDFSCDDQKNVTVVLGDNTVGKTTLAQAFRWCLYGALLTEGRKKSSDYQLLNNDILEKMDANSRAKVSVEIVATEGEKTYRIYREAGYTRLYPKLMTREYQKKLKVTYVENPEFGEEILVDPGNAQELIGELFPRDLSHYFLFDGERWDDVTVNGVRENIRESVHILTGLSSYKAALKHLKDMGSGSVISKFKSKIQGSGSLYDNLEEKKRRDEREIARLEGEQKSCDINMNNYAKKKRELEDFLEQNKDTEKNQLRLRQLQTIRKSQGDRYRDAYKYFVNRFSDKGYMLFAQPMMETALSMVKSVAGERRDIPHMRQASIDYILKTGRCICGTEIRAHSREYECLMEQRNYLPPADIGSLLGEFEKTVRRWKNQADGFAGEMKEEAQKIDDALRDLEQTGNELTMLERQLDEHHDFADTRRRIRGYQAEIDKLARRKGEMEGRIQSYQREIARTENDMRMQEAKNAENKKWRKRVDIAEAVYERMKSDFSKKERKIFLELNEHIQKNFERMFNARDKKVQLSENYEIQMFYRAGEAFREEKNLSEGEKIARNFAFIVTIMEYSRKKKQERQMLSEEGDTLPIVLDGPFSKLGDENIGLVAGVLPEVSEQVILFMLRKDWQYTGLDDYVGASYSIDKAADQSFASIRKTGGIM